MRKVNPEARLVHISTDEVYGDIEEGSFNEDDVLMNQFPEKLIPKTIIRAKMDMKIPIYGTGKNVRDWIYVNDHCKAINFVLERGEKGEIYNISSGDEKSNLEVVNEILDIMGKKNLIEFVEDRPGHDARYSLDSSKIRKSGWKPKYGFSDGLKETVEWYLENEWWWQPLADEKILHPTEAVQQLPNNHHFFGYIIRGMVRNGGKKRQNGAVMAIAPGC